MKTRFLKLRRSAQLWVPVCLVLTVGWTLSWGLAQMLSRQLQTTVQERVSHQADMFTAALAQRVYAMGDLVQGMQTVFTQVPELGRKRFANGLLQDLYLRYPGVGSLIYTQSVPVAEYPALWKALQQEANEQPWVIEDLLSPQFIAQGTGDIAVHYLWVPGKTPSVVLDVGRQPAARDLLERVQRTQALQMSAPILLRQLSIPTTGFLISAPVQALQPDGTFKPAGTVSMSIQVQVLLDALYETGGYSNLLLSVRDIGAWPPSGRGMALAAEGQILYMAKEQNRFGDVATLERELDLLGRRWTLRFVADAQASSRVESAYPWIVGGGGAIATGLLAFIVWLLVHQRALALLRAKARLKRLQYRTNRFNAMFNQAAVGVAEIDPTSGRYQRMNRRFAENFGFTVQEMLKCNAFEVIYAEDREDCYELSQALIRGEIAHFTKEVRMQHRNGQIVWAEVWVSPLVGRTGQPVGNHIVIGQDITQRRQLQEQLRSSEANMRAMLYYMPVGLVVIGRQGQIEFVNQQFEMMTGWCLDDLSDELSLWERLCVNVNLQNVAQSASSLDIPASNDRLPASEYMLRTRNGRDLPVEMSGRLLDGRTLVSLVDLSSRKQAEDKIYRLAFYDTLTQLPNRRLLWEQVTQVLSKVCATPSNGALLLMDIDRFKSLKDRIGHQYIDALLRLIAMRLAGRLPRQHMLARQEGDEFAVVLENLSDNREYATQQAEQIGYSLLQAIRSPFFLAGQELQVTASMGIAIFGNDPSLSTDELFKQTSLALNQAKSVGRDRLQTYSPALQQVVTERLEMDKDLRQALEREEFELYFQPQVQKGQGVLGVEALLRWKHPDKGFISPGLFIPAAEKSDLILWIGEWVLKTACQQLASWVSQPRLSHLAIAVNVSPRQFYQSDFVGQVQQALALTGAPADRLELELTEGMLLSDVDGTVDKMVQLKEIGVRFSLDDFGTGYSSLSYLKRLPLDKLKIDQSFVRDVLTNTNDASITRTIIALGHSLNLNVVAEGVETQDQCQFLADNGCTFWQGYLFSRPVPAADFEAWLQQQDDGWQP